MNLTQTTTTDAPSPAEQAAVFPQEATDHAEEVTEPKQISLPRALLLAPFRPAWVAERTTHLPLKRAWLGHWFSAVSTFVVIGLLLLWANWPTLGPNHITKAVQATQRELALLISQLARFPIESTLAVIGVIALVEVGHLALALNLMSWGARDEPLRNTFGFALRQTWLSGARISIAIMIIGGPLAAIEYENQTWSAAYTGPKPPEDLVLPARPVISRNDPGFAKAMADHKAAVDAYFRIYEPVVTARREWSARRPWLLKVPYAIGVPLGFMTSLWFLWALVRSMGATRNVPPIAHERRCIECGYNLHTIAMESRCPECGKPVVESLGPKVHPGTPWQHHPPGGVLRTWWQCAVDVVREPGAFGRTLRVRESTTAHRRFFAIALVAISLVAETALLLTVGLLSFPREALRDPELLAIVPCATGCLCVGGAVLFACAAATLVGLTQSFTYGRNLLPTAMQTACYLGGFLVLWSIIGAALIIGLVWLGESNSLDAVAQRIGIPADMLGLLYFGTPNLICAGFFIHRLAVATGATRYANK